MLLLFQSRRNLCEEALLKIKGVISFTFQMAVQRCVVRIRSDLKAEVSILNAEYAHDPRKQISVQICPFFYLGLGFGISDSINQGYEGSASCEK